MSCDRFHELILDDLVVGLPAGDRLALDEHLESCVNCAALARQLRVIWSDLPPALRRPVDGLAALREQAGRELGRDVAPPAPTGRRWRRSLLRAAAVVFVLGAGVLGGMQIDRLLAPKEGPTAGKAADSREQFVLLIYEPGELDQRARASRDVGNWAAELHRRGIVEDGSGLKETSAWAGPPPGELAEGRRLTHYITIRAADLEDAQRIAATVPTTAYGGVVEVRPLGW